VFATGTVTSTRRVSRQVVSARTTLDSALLAAAEVCGPMATSALMIAAAFNEKEAANLLRSLA
jgi:hypothetical protein